MKTVLAMVGWSCLAMSWVGFVETAIGLFNKEGYHLGKVIVYSILFGVGIGLLK